MLENLNQIDWERLTHAYGSAKDIPQQIFKLTSKDEKIWWSSFGKLSNYILYRDKYIFEATSYTVPFLIELVKKEQTLNREHLLELLAGISNGTSYQLTHQRLSSMQENYSEIYLQEVHKELEWVERAKEAVAKGISVYYQLVHDPDLAVREAAIYTLASVKWLKEDMLHQLREKMLIETNPLILTNLIFALGTQRDKHEQTVNFLNDCIEKNEEPLIQLAAAMALVHIQEGKVHDRTIQVLIDAIRDPDRVSAYDNLLFASIDVIHDTTWLFSQLSHEQAIQSLPLLQDVFNRTNNALVAVELTRAMLMIAFNKKRVLQGIRFHELTEEQQKTLQCIAENHVAWEFNVNMAEVLRDFRLPCDCEKFRLFIRGKEW
ncbi:HEAT repeat domain-containing protein [Thermoflavimicrobium dichotomicum]|uniref:HEAT repeat-containing protein n=1 Tax=Thermoflavimicrobium dichotomicum TaxID=46223 RepID=A0A1I3UAX5_9BACL|nr:HEAT repeat domain-containing protein [Thermoflavimicrobium dichotomicum]SFJ78941.1 hypothetical protein SAMN05421852_12239 [Thermoflavimicrobium dichotomicum]